jgi:cytochrome c
MPLTRKKGDSVKAISVVVVAAGVLAAGPGFAQSGADVVKAKGCLGCHDVAVKKVGPSFKDVAAKYKSDTKAPATLVGKLKEGKGHLKIAASDAELKAAVGHVLATK